MWVRFLMIHVDKKFGKSFVNPVNFPSSSSADSYPDKPVESKNREKSHWRELLPVVVRELKNVFCLSSLF